MTVRAPKPLCAGTWLRPDCRLELGRRARGGVCATCHAQCRQTITRLTRVWKRLAKLFKKLADAIVAERLARAMLLQWKRIYRRGRRWENARGDTVRRGALVMLASEDCAKLLDRRPLCIIRDNRLAELLEPTP